MFSVFNSSYKRQVVSKREFFLLKKRRIDNEVHHNTVKVVCGPLVFVSWMHNFFENVTRQPERGGRGGREGGESPM